MDLKGIVTPEFLDEMIEQGYITKRPNNAGTLFVLNYTPKAAFDRVWNNATLNCRGLVINTKNEVIARPFQKFFNLSDYLESGKVLPNTTFSVNDKLDGSLIIVFNDGKKTDLCTRGSFNSTQANDARNWLFDIFPTFSIPTTETYLMEWIGPSNRIVVNYEENELILLDIIEVWNGGSRLPFYRNMREGENTKSINGIRLVESYKVDNINDLIGIERQNKEGYVVKYDSGLRLKIKHSEYTRLHRILTNVTPKTIWKYLSEDDSVGRDLLIDNAPDEFYKWIMNIENALRTDAQILESKVRGEYLHIFNPLDSKKDFAKLAIKSENYYFLFLLWDQNEEKFQKEIWKRVKPTALMYDV